MLWEFDKCCQLVLSSLPPSHKDYDHGFEYDKLRPSLLYRPPGGYDPNICTGSCHVMIIESARATCPAPALGCFTHVAVQDISPKKVSRVTWIFNFHWNCIAVFNLKRMSNCFLQGLLFQYSILLLRGYKTGAGVMWPLKDAIFTEHRAACPDSRLTHHLICLALTQCLRYLCAVLVPDQEPLSRLILNM